MMRLGGEGGCRRAAQSTRHHCWPPSAAFQAMRGPRDGMRPALEKLCARLLGCLTHPVGAVLARLSETLREEAAACAGSPGMTEDVADRMLARVSYAADELCSTFLAESLMRSTPEAEQAPLDLTSASHSTAQVEASEMASELLVYKSAHAPLLQALGLLHEAEEARMRLGAARMLKRAAPRHGALSRHFAHPSQAACSKVHALALPRFFRQWAKQIAFSPAPSDKLRACIALCDSIARAQGGEVKTSHCLIRLHHYGY